jgi:hypothetical protein
MPQKMQILIAKYDLCIFVLLCGKLDSANTCLYWAKKKYSEEVFCNYLQLASTCTGKHATLRLAKTADMIINKLIEIEFDFLVILRQHCCCYLLITL